MVRVEINGPATIASGQWATYSAIEHLSDGTRRTPSTAAWSSSDPTVIQINSSGRATAYGRWGEAVVSVRTTLSASMEVMVLPAGTFRLAGRVLDDQSGEPIPGAYVYALRGPSVTTNATGTYKLYGVPASADIGVSREGYRRIDQHLELTSHSTREFRLSRMPGVGPPPNPPLQLAGNYTLTLTAANSCATPSFAGHLKVRSYEATVVQSNSQLEVILTEPRFNVVSGIGNRFRGDVTPTGATFTISDGPFYYYYRIPELRELLFDNSTLEIWGTSTTTGSAQGLTGEFASGSFRHLSQTGDIVGTCAGSRFALWPR